MSKRKKKGVSTKVFLSLLALVLVLGCAVGGTIAWLTASTAPVVNTFTYGKVDIELIENDSWGKPSADGSSSRLYTVIPGFDFTKDPRVKITEGSEYCYIFIKVTEENWLDAKDSTGKRKLDYKIFTQTWKALEDVPGVYYCVYDDSHLSLNRGILDENKVTVSKELTKEEIREAKNLEPRLTFKAYAVQKEGSSTAAEAWAKIPEKDKN